MAVSWSHEQWDAFGSMLSGVGTITGVFAVIGAAFLGRQTFESWRTQKLAERRMDQALHILAAAYSARRGLSLIRTLIFSPGELQAAARQWSGDEPPTRDDQVYTATFLRFDSTADTRKELVDCLPLARALFGEELEKALDDLNRLFIKVMNNVNLRYRHEHEPIAVQVYPIVAEGYPSKDENPTDVEIATLIATIERICLSNLKD